MVSSQQFLLLLVELAEEQPDKVCLCFKLLLGTNGLVTRQLLTMTHAWLRRQTVALPFQHGSNRVVAIHLSNQILYKNMPIAGVCVIVLSIVMVYFEAGSVIVLSEHFTS